MAKKMDSKNLDSKQTLVSYISHTNFHAQLIDEQLQLQNDAQTLVKAVRDDVDYDDPKKKFWMSRDIKGRIEHQRILQFLFELEKKIDHYIEVMCTKYSLVLTVSFNAKELKSFVSSSLLNEFPQLISLVVEYHKNIDDLHDIASTLKHMEWDVLDYDIDKIDIESNEIDFGDSWNREINVKDDLNVYDTLPDIAPGTIPDLEISYDRDDDLHDHIIQIAEQFTSYYQQHMDAFDEIDLTQVMEHLTSQEQCELQSILKNHTVEHTITTVNQIHNSGQQDLGPHLDR